MVTPGMRHVMGKPVKVSIPLASFHLSGGVKVLVLLANGMADQGWGTTFLVPDYASVSPFALDPRIRVRVVPTGPRWLPRKLKQMTYYGKLLGLAGGGAHLCLANYYLTAYCAVASSWLTGRKTSVLWYIQGYEAGSHGLMAEDGIIGRLLRYVLASLSYRLPVPVWCVSGWVKDRIGRTDAKVVYPPALNLSRFAPKDTPRCDARVVIGTIGRRGATKGYEDFLKALEALPSVAGIHFLVASPLPNEVPLPPHVSAEAVHATNEAAMADFYHRCDIFVLPSRMEGFPLPPLEAMACGCAVVATLCGGIVEYAREEVNCLLVPTRDPASLARAIERLIRDQSLRERLGSEAVRTAGSFGYEAMVKNFVQQVAGMSGAEYASRERQEAMTR